MAKYSFRLKKQSILNIDLQIRRIVNVLFKKRAGSRLRIVLSGLKDVSRLEVFKPDNTPFLIQINSFLHYHLDLGLFWSEILDLKLSRVFIRYKHTH